jgi:hypothetical protein
MQKRATEIYDNFVTEVGGKDRSPSERARTQNSPKIARASEHAIRPQPFIASVREPTGAQQPRAASLSSGRHGSEG